MEYASRCGGCVCADCVNNVNCMSVTFGEQIEPCFNCDDCYNYNDYGNYNKKYNCEKYVITEKRAKEKRSYFKQIN